MIQGQKIKKIGWLIFLWLGISGTTFAQYKVAGGVKEPFLAVENTNYKTQVYLVYGMENVTISYSSSSSSHKWYRYKTKLSEREPVVSTLQGVTSVISNLTEGYGYFVIEEDNPNMSHIVWLIDYSKYPVDIQNLHVSDNTNPCVSIQLGATDHTKSLYYWTSGGQQELVDRQFEVVFWTEKWQESSKQFIRDPKVLTIGKSDLFTNVIDSVPLCDTEFTVKGDLFARHFGVEKSYSTDLYSAVALEVHVDTLVLSDNQSNMSLGANEMLSPAEIRFTAYANTTSVAPLYTWKITNEQNKETITRTGEQMEYIFDQAGSYTVNLEVYGQPGKEQQCENKTHSFNIKITETDMHIPNVFTPEGSPGVNDEFRVAYKSISRFRAWIFNRWGAELFHWTDPSKGWDGKYRGKYVPAGPYYYVIEYTGTDGKTRKRTGDINVVRSSREQIKTK